jgi:hypothetical protein
MSKLEDLRNCLFQLAPGPVVEAHEVERLLCESWGAIDGNNSVGMVAYKLLNRTENMIWNAPLLEFEIERHGPTARGSAYAGIQVWRIDVQNATAMLDENETRRLVGERDKPPKIEPIVGQMMQSILDHKDDRRLKWLDPTCVRVNISEAIPATNAQTTSTRRGRFRNPLEASLNAEGWQKIPGKMNTFSLRPNSE